MKLDEETTYDDAPPNAANLGQRLRARGLVRAVERPRMRRRFGTAFSPAGQERHLLLHGWRRVARRFVRPQAEARRLGRPSLHHLDQSHRPGQSSMAQKSVALSP